MKHRYSDQFIDSQVAYYKKHLNCGSLRDWDQIRGLYHYYLELQNERRKPLADQ